MASNLLIMLSRYARFGNRLFMRRNTNSPASLIRFPFTYNSRTNTYTLLSRFCSGKSVDALENDEINYQNITNGDPGLVNKLKMLILETDLLRQSGFRVPSNLNDSNWKMLLDISSKSRREKYLLLLFKHEKTKENLKKKKDENRKQREEDKETLGEASVDDYFIHKNSMFLRIYDTAIGHYENARLLYHSLFTKPLVIDCSFENNMNRRECGLAAKQMMLFFGSNRAHKDPLDLHVCNIRSNSHVMNVFSKFIPTIYEPWFPINLHSKSYLDIFPKEQLVYLTPDCRNDMAEYDHNAIYIIGCIVDKGSTEPITLAKAKKEGIKMARFPLEKYIEWGTGADKTLTLNQIVDILLDKRAGKSWEATLLKHIPRRKRADVQREGQLKKLRKERADFYGRLIHEVETRSPKRIHDQENNNDAIKNDEIKYVDKRNVNVSRNYEQEIISEEDKHNPENLEIKDKNVYGYNRNMIRYINRQKADVPSNSNRNDDEEMHYSRRDNVQEKYAHGYDNRETRDFKRKNVDNSRNYERRIFDEEQTHNRGNKHVQEKYRHGNDYRKFKNLDRQNEVSANYKDEEEMHYSRRDNVKEKYVHGNDNRETRYFDRQNLDDSRNNKQRVFDEELLDPGNEHVQDKYRHGNDNRKFKNLDRQNASVSSNFKQRRQKLRVSTIFDDDSKF